jgi:hypothetical protein
VNLSDGGVPEVRLSGEPVPVIEASAGELLVRPLAHHVDGPIEVIVTGERATGFYDVGPAEPHAATVAPLSAEESQ